MTTNLSRLSCEARPVTRLDDDDEFLSAARELAVTSGLMRAPRYDAASSSLTDGALSVCLLEAWHASLASRASLRAHLAELCSPPDLITATRHGRVDVVERFIRDAQLHDGVAAIDAAIGARVVTDAHVECVARLLAAGVPVVSAHWDTWAAESCGTNADLRMRALLSQARE
jgi:hypothetical protein